jgi:hypothetical protein
MDNSMHYVPPGGQVVIGVRWMEHKGKPLLLFFVMDNFAVAHEGSVWVESKTGKACTFFMRVRPDSAR